VDSEIKGTLTCKKWKMNFIDRKTCLKNTKTNKEIMASSEGLEDPSQAHLQGKEERGKICNIHF
jgi:hypothetical protein